MNVRHTDLVPVKSGVPQGSVLGSLLLLVYVSDIPSVVKCTAKLFADDTKIYRRFPHQQRQPPFRPMLTPWWPGQTGGSCLLMSGNASNSVQEMLVCSTPCEETVWKRRTLKETLAYTSTLLLNRKQASAVVAKANQVLAVIRRSSELINACALPLLYKALVRPHLEFGNVVLGPFNRADQLLVERVQRKATRLVPSIRHR